MPELVTLADIEAARDRIADVIRPTPIVAADALSTVCGVELRLKLEQLQRTGSFKIRGAYNHISRLPPGTDVVAASAGNHAQGVALAASLAGLRSTIFMPEAAPLPKINATEDYGADIRFHGATVDDAIEAAAVHARRTGAHLVPPFDDPLIIAGQGTLGLELLDRVAGATVVVPVGGGGLIAGVGVALKESGADIRLVGVEAETAASMRASLAAGSVTTVHDVTTIADGIAVKAPSALTLAHAQRYVDEVVTVDDSAIGEALVLLLERVKAVVEPSAAAALAAVLTGAVAGSGPVLLVLSGGNVDPLLLTHLVERGLSAAGRYVRFEITVPDRPGGLAAAAADLADTGLNILDIEHHRAGSATALGQVAVAVTAETRGPEHRDGALDTLRDRGWTIEVLD